METRVRTMAKTISWRVLATIITACVVGFMTGKVELGLSAGMLDCAIKILVYYMHERTWARLRFGYINNVEGKI